MQNESKPTDSLADTKPVKAVYVPPALKRLQEQQKLLEQQQGVKPLNEKDKTQKDKSFISSEKASLGLPRVQSAANFPTVKDDNKRDLSFFTERSNSQKSFAPTGNRPTGSGEKFWAPRNKTIEAKLFKPSTSGINFSKYEDIPIQVKGNDVVQPITNFEESNLDLLVKFNIGLAQFSNPTPVQKHSVAIVTAGRDLMACAQTGSGKTAAFLFPIISQTLKNPNPAPVSYEYVRPIARPQTLILAPTRELAIQIHEEAVKYCYRSHLKPVCIYGGADTYPQVRELERGCDLLVATPGRLVDLLERKRITLANVKFLVLDEADRMLDMGFEPQIRNIVQDQDMPETIKRQTLMFSATFPKNIQELASEFLNNYIFLSVGKVGSTSENITQAIFEVEEKDKKCKLVDLLKTSPKGLTLVFVATKRQADHLDDFLYSQKFLSASIHGDRTQAEREEALRNFRSGKVEILVATAVASRGLDIPNVTHVINYDLPGDIDDYVHRIGRTGRAGNVGQATSFFNTANNKNLAKELVSILKEANQKAPMFLEKAANYFSGSSSGSSGYKKGPQSNFKSKPNVSNVEQQFKEMQFKDVRNRDWSSTPNLAEPKSEWD